MVSSQHYHLEKCQPHLRLEETQLKTPTISRLEKIQQPQIYRLHKQEPPRQYPGACCPTHGWEEKFLQIGLFAGISLLTNGRTGIKKMLASIFTSRRFAKSRLTEGFTRSLSACSSLIREYLDSVIKADQCAQYVDNTGIVANDPQQLISKLKAVSAFIQKNRSKINNGKMAR